MPARAREAVPGLRMRTHLVLLICIALVPVILFSAGMLFAMARQEHEALQASLKEKAAQLAADVDHELQRTIAKLEVLGQSARLSEGDLPGFDSMARRVLKADPTWQNVMLISTAGEQLVNLRLPFGSPLPKLNRPDLPVKAAQSLQPVVSDMAQAVIARRPLTAIYVPLVRDGTARYVLAAAIEPPNWKKALRAQLPSGIHALLLDARGSVVTGTDDEAAATAQEGDGKGVLDVAAVHDRPRLEDRVRQLVGRDAYVAYQTSSSSGWTVVTFVPAEEFDGRVRRSGAVLGFGFLLLLSFGVSLALLLGKRTARSISELVASVKAVAHGGPPLPLSAHVAEVNEAGRALTETATLLAARLRREEAARAQIETANRAKNAFLAMLGHELRNPLAAIRNGVEILKRTGSASEAAQRATAIMDRQSAHITRLVDDLLDLARIEQGKIELRKEVVDLRAVLRSTLEDQRAAAEAAGVRVYLELPAAAVWVHVDRVRVAQVVGNLVHNAVKFTGKGGEVRLALAQRGDDAEIRVQDSGAGIEPAALERIFEPFVQGDQEHARARGGLGLGLALVKTLVELHGGSVRAASAGQGQGAEFTVSLPGANQAA